jgi:hypothetical protein
LAAFLEDVLVVAGFILLLVAMVMFLRVTDRERDARIDLPNAGSGTGA